MPEHIANLLASFNAICFLIIIYNLSQIFRYKKITEEEMKRVIETREDTHQMYLRWVKRNKELDPEWEE